MTNVDKSYTVVKDSQSVKEFVSYLQETLGLSSALNPAELIKEATFFKVVRESAKFKDFFMLAADEEARSDSTLGAQTQNHFEIDSL